MQDQLHLIKRRKWRKVAATFVILCGVALLVGTFAAPKVIMDSVIGMLLLQYFPKNASIIAHFGSLGLAVSVIFLGALLQTNN